MALGIVILLLAMNFAAFFFVTNPKLKGGDGAEVEPTPPGPDYVALEGDVTWTGKSGGLEGPLYITGGSHLRMVECNLTVDLLDLVLGNHSWVTVAKGASLTLERSRLAIVYDPELEGAVFSSYYYRNDKGPPSISRVVNLEGAAKPVLSIGLYWWAGRSPVTVAVQRSPGSPLENVSALVPSNGTLRQWTRFDVPLEAYAGTAVRVVIYSSDGNGTRDLFIGRTLVLDGESDLPWDQFPAGRVWKDGWLCVNYRPFFTEMGSYGTNFWRGLMTSDGRVSIAGSTVEAPYRIPRYDLEFATAKFPDMPVDKFYGSVEHFRDMTSGGGEMRLSGPKLSITDSAIRNIPLVVSNASVDIERSLITGDGDLLAINESLGTISDCEFVNVPFVELNPEYNDPGESGRGLIVDFNTTEGVVRVSDCNFSGSRTAVDLNHARMEMEGCHFRNVSDLAIWDHDTRGLGTWAQIASRNSFAGVAGDMYFKTHSAVVELTGPGRPPEGATQGYHTGLVDWEGWDGDYRQDIIDVDCYRAHMLMPTLEVEASGTINTIREIILDVETCWGGANDVAIATDVRSTTLLLTQYASIEYGFERARLSIAKMSCDSPGVASMRIRASVPDKYETSYALWLSLDGETQAVYFGRFAEKSIYSNYDGEFSHNQTIPAGLHVLRIVLDGLDMESGVERLTEASLAFLRLSGGEDPTAARGFIAEGAGTIMLDPGVVLRCTRLDAAGLDDDDEFAVSAILSEGSNLSLEGVSLPTPSTLAISASGHGRLALMDPELDGLTVSSRGTDIDVTGVRSNTTHLSLSGGHHHLGGLSIAGRATIFLSEKSSAVLEDSSIASSSCWFEVGESCVTVERTHFAVPGDSGVEIGHYNNATIIVANSTFQGSGLTLYTYYPGNLSLWVHGCTFAGAGARLWTQNSGSPDLLNGTIIEHNTFTGQGSGLIIEDMLLERMSVERPSFLHDNTYEAGGRLFCWYYVNPTINASSEDLGGLRFVPLLDRDRINLVTLVLGRGPEPWEGVIWALPVDSMDTGLPVSIRYRIDAGASNHNLGARWPVAFGTATLPMGDMELTVPDWEDISRMVLLSLGRG